MHSSPLPFQMATSFSALYDAVRVATGNDDPVIGAEVMPDSRCDVLIRTAAACLQGFSRSFETVAVQQNATTQTWEIFPAQDPTASIKDITISALAHAAAYRYFVGLGNEKAAADLYLTISDLALIAGGEPIVGYKALGIIPERFQQI